MDSLLKDKGKVEEWVANSVKNRNRTLKYVKVTIINIFNSSAEGVIE